MNLIAAQINAVRSIVDQSQLTLPALKEDVLDHLCCRVEERMDSGESFEDALNNALYEFAPDGLDEIQYETDFLLTSNIVPMKKLMYSIGLATSISITMGLMMKLLHMPGGEEMINYGFLGFALLFMPMLTMSLYKNNSRWASHERFKVIFAIVSAMLTGLAVLFKMTMNLDWSANMLIVGASVFSFGFLPLHFYGMYRKSVAV